MTPDWPAFCRDTRVGVQAALAGLTTRAEREQSYGLGEGGDETVAVDAASEAVVLQRLDALHRGGEQFVVVSEEAGTRSYGNAPNWWLAVDPIDGSKNAKRNLPYYSLSIAVAEGPTMGDVVYGYVFDLATGEEWTASRQEGAWLDGVPLDARDLDEGLGVVALEATRPHLLVETMPALAERCEVVRVLGSLALSLCQLAGGRIDGVAALRPVRSVDIAAGQLIARESGARVVYSQGAPLAAAPLDLERRSAVHAARGERALRSLAEALRH